MSAHRCTRRRFLTAQAILAGADAASAIEAVSSTALAHPEWDMDEVRDWDDWIRGDADAVPQREATSVPVGEAPGHSPALDQEVRVEDRPSQAEEGQTS